MPKKVEEALRRDKYVVVSRVGKMNILAYSGRSKREFSNNIINNSDVNLHCYIDGKPIHKERILADDRTW